MPTSIFRTTAHSRRAVLCIAILLGVSGATLPDMIQAQIYNGPGIVGGIDAAKDVGGVSGDDIQTVILDILKNILLFMGLAAVVVIVIAGISLVISLGDDTAKDKAKKIILYAIVGLLVILLASAIVGIIASSATSS